MDSISFSLTILLRSQGQIAYSRKFIRSKRPPPPDPGSICRFGSLENRVPGNLDIKSLIKVKFANDLLTAAHDSSVLRRVVNSNSNYQFQFQLSVFNSKSNYAFSRFSIPSPITKKKQFQFQLCGKIFNSNSNSNQISEIFRNIKVRN